MRSLRWSIAPLVALSVSMTPGLALACATCGAGDPTLAIAGTEQPFAGRVRLAAVVQHTSYSDPDASVLEQRLILGGSVALADVALVTVGVPLVWRETAYPTLAHDSTVGLGDVDARMRVTLFRDRPFAPAQRLVLEVGTRIPTAPALTHQGALLPLPAQLGTGAFEPLLGASWIASIDETSLWVGVQGAFPLTGLDGWRNGLALRSSIAVQWQPLTVLALRAALDSRLEGTSGRAPDAVGDPSFLLFAGGGLVLSPGGDAVLHLLVRAPVVQLADEAHGSRWDGVTVEAGVALDV